MVNVRYFIFGREKGDGTAENPDGTAHYQGYIEFSRPKRFSTMKGYFSENAIGVNAHIKPRYAKRLDCVNYVKKIGKHKDKAHTRIGELCEYGEFIGEGERKDLPDMIEMKISGAKDTEIFESFPNSYGRYNNFVNEMALSYKAEKFMNMYRDNMEVYYIYGATRTGKTRHVFDKYGYQNVYRNQGYTDGKWFDGYVGQDVLLLDEYRSNFDFGMLLQYLDGQPLMIQCRFKNKPACYTKVYITSNIPLKEQYKEIQRTDNESWKALLSRITAVYNFDVSKDNPVSKIQGIEKKSLEQLQIDDDDGGELPF